MDECICLKDRRKLISGETRVRTRMVKDRFEIESVLLPKVAYLWEEKNGWRRPVISVAHARVEFVATMHKIYNALEKINEGKEREKRKRKKKG